MCEYLKEEIKRKRTLEGDKHIFILEPILSFKDRIFPMPAPVFVSLLKYLAYSSLNWQPFIDLHQSDSYGRYNGYKFNCSRAPPEFHDSLSYRFDHNEIEYFVYVEDLISFSGSKSDFLHL